MHGPVRLSYAFLANYVPKCQMSSGPYGPILIDIITSTVLVSFTERIPREITSENLQINSSYERNLCHILTVKPNILYFQDKNSSNEVDVAEVTGAEAGQ